MPSEDGWLTVEEAAAQLGVGPRTVERWAAARKLGVRARGRGFPTLYNPADVDRVLMASQPDARTGVLEPGLTQPPNGHGAIAHQRHDPTSVAELLDLVLERLLAKLPQGPTDPTGPTQRPTGPTPDDWMTPFAIARAWRWPQRVVLVLMDEGNFGKPVDIGTPAHPRRVVRRAAVEAFAKARKDLEQL